MTEVCSENHKKVFVEKGKISDRCFEPCRVKETVAKQREIALERNKFNRCEALVWSVVSYSILPGLLFLQNMDLFVDIFGYPTCHWSPQFSQLNWAPLKLILDFFRIKSLPCSMICFSLGRVRVLWSVLHLVCSYDLCRGFSLAILWLVGVCHLAVEQRNPSLTIRGSLTKILREQ